MLDAGHFDYKVDYEQDGGTEKMCNMLLMSTQYWIMIGVAVVIVAGVIGRKI